MEILSVSFNFSPLTAQNWPDLELLFGAKGACGGCWCMTPRLSSSDYQKNKGAGNKVLLHRLVNKQEPLGILGYCEREPVAWCSISPKPTLLSMKKSRIMQLTGDEGVWSIVCIFIQKDYRRKGVSSLLIREAANYARSKGAIRVEAYPVKSIQPNMPDAFAWNGLWTAYGKAGFKVIKQLSHTRLIMSQDLTT